MIPSPLTLAEWERAIAADPAAAGPILQELAARLGEYSAANARLRAELAAWQSGEHVAALEARLAELTSQIARLEAAAAAPTPVVPRRVLAWTPAGAVRRLALDPAAAVRLEGAAWADTVGLAQAAADAALLALFDSGRVLRLGDERLADERLGDERLDPEGRERLAALFPLDGLARAAHVCQISRLGFVKRSQPDHLSGHIARGYIGAGATLAADRGWGLAALPPGARLVIVSRWGAVAAFDPAALPFTTVEALQLPDGDGVVAAFALADTDSLAAFSDGGMALVRAASWLETAATPSRGQALLSPRRRAAGVRLVGGGAVGPDAGDVVILTDDGALTGESLAEVVARGRLAHEGGLRAVGFCA
jgi:hypothetical protein